MTVQQNPPNDHAGDSGRDWRTLDYCAAHIGVTKLSIRNWIARGYLPAYRIGSTVRVDRRDLDALLQRIPPGDGAA